jgi:hypothetical protein
MQEHHLEDAALAVAPIISFSSLLLFMVLAACFAPQQVLRFGVPLAGAPHIILKLVQVDAEDISKRVHWKVSFAPE